MTQSVVTPAVTVCVQPTSGNGPSSGVMMTTFANGKRLLEQTVVADGTGHPVSESGCVGTQTSDWSRDGLRLFTRVEMACNDRPKQTISGLTLFANGPAWVDIQAMNADGDQQVRIRRYVRTLDQPEGLAALPAAVTAGAIIDAQNASTRKLSLEDVSEANAKVSSQAVEAAIVETESRFNLNSRALLQLANAGVSPNVIDLMVAQSFPAHFTVERPITVPFTPLAASTTPPMVGVPTAQYPTAYPIYPYGVYDPYSYYSYYYSPFAYPYYWGNGYYRGPTYYISNGNSTVITSGSGGTPGTATGSSSDRGQVVNGRGYTRVHSGSEPDAGTANPNQHTTSSTPRTVRGTTSSTSGADSSSSSSSSSGSSSSGTGGVSSSGGYSGGGDSGGRTAQPR